MPGTTASPIRDLGPCQVVWDIETAGGTVIDATFGGVEMKDTVKTKDVQEDQQGDAAVDSITTGREVEVTVPMTRAALAKLGTFIHGATAGGANLIVTNAVGTALYALAKSLTIKQYKDGAASTSEAEWLYFYKAYPVSQIDWKFDNAGQRMVKIVFKIFPSQASPNVGKMWRIGAAS